MMIVVNDISDTYGHMV